MTDPNNISEKTEQIEHSVAIHLFVIEAVHHHYSPLLWRPLRWWGSASNQRSRSRRRSVSRSRCCVQTDGWLTVVSIRVCWLHIGVRHIGLSSSRWRSTISVVMVAVMMWIGSVTARMWSCHWALTSSVSAHHIWNIVEFQKKFLEKLFKNKLTSVGFSQERRSIARLP